MEPVKALINLKAHFWRPKDIANGSRVSYSRASVSRL